jgi:hypothetical protein
MTPDHTRALPMEGPREQQARSTVVCHCPERRQLQAHERETHRWLAQRIAALGGHEFGGEFDPTYRYERPLYFVPSDTLLLSESHALGIAGEHQMFGGVVPYAFVATKTITHALSDQDAQAPRGWSPAFCEQVKNDVLPGYSAFARDDLRRAALRLLKQGSIRMKLPEGMGGLGQSVIRSADELEEFLRCLDEQALQRMGVVVEANLNEVATYSVGQSRVGNLLISYCGTQKLTHSNHGKQVYGGSDLIVVRGDFDRLLQLELDEPLRTAISQARVYHRSALTCYPGMFASRANYDVARGIDDSGQRHAGVLEQSWRIGGATAAEIAALDAFLADPALHAVRASTTEVYGTSAKPPSDATVYYQGTDESIGPLTKYSLIRNYVDA